MIIWKDHSVCKQCMTCTYMYWEQTQNAVSSFEYQKNFHYDYNLRFQKPSKDRCDICEISKNEGHKTEAEEMDHALHLATKDADTPKRLQFNTYMTSSK